MSLVGGLLAKPRADVRSLKFWPPVGSEEVRTNQDRVKHGEGGLSRAAG